MPKLRVHNFSVSLDGFAAGPDQSLDHPLGRGGLGLHEWFFPTRTFQRIHGSGDGATGLDDQFAACGIDNIGAWIMGRNMFGPVRGKWPDHAWRGWWGDNPPFQKPVFILTHHARPSLTMQGGTVFHFITGGIEAARTRATEAAGGLDVAVSGGAATIRQFLRARLIDHMHIVIAPILLGRGESLLAGLDLLALGYTVSEVRHSEHATHVVIT